MKYFFFVASPKFEITLFQDGDTRVYTAYHQGKEMNYKKALNFMEISPEFRLLLTKTLKDCPFNAYVWETVPISRQKLEETIFEFAITESINLNMMPKDKKTFKTHFEKSNNKYVTSFENLNGDAMLIAPLPKRKMDYAHLDKFINNASEEQIDAFWTEISCSMNKRLADSDVSTPFWLSTAGHGVAWVHARIDSRPKYYTYSPYKSYIPATSGITPL